MMIQNNELEAYIDEVDVLLDEIPFVFYKDNNGVYRGGNLNQAKLFGFDHPSKFIGKTIFDILPDKQAAKLIDQRDRHIMQAGVAVVTEEAVTTPLGPKIYLSQKQPIHDVNNRVIGILGFAVDITDIRAKRQRAEAEREKYQVEIDHYKKLTEQQGKFQQIAKQVAHDIVSPLSALNTIISMLKDIPEKHRITLKQAATRIEDVTNDLLKHYQVPHVITDKNQEPDIFFTYLGLREILSEKRVEYHALPITFSHQLTDPDAYFAFIRVDSKSFRRMLSNLLNNAVNAIQGKAGAIQIKLVVKNNNVIVTIGDNGKGMSGEVKSRILSGLPILDEKKRQGIGLSQVRDTLRQNHGTMDIESTEGVGSKIILTFPKSHAPNWAATQLVIRANQTILILDDDPFIHGAWEARFNQMLVANPEIRLIHFTKGQELLDFVAPLTQQEKNSLYLLSDHELIDQGINGLKVIDQAQLSNAMLVTSHYTNPNVLAYANHLRVPVLPKRLASKVPIRVIPSNDQVVRREADIILIDDSQVFADAIIFRLPHRKIIHYVDPHAFIAECEEYAKNTPICIDNHFEVAMDVDGIEVAKLLHALGFSRLYIVSGAHFDLDTLPSYVTLIRKMNLEMLDGL